MRFVRSILLSSVISGIMVTTVHAETIEELNRSLNNINNQVSNATSQKNELQDETEKLKQALESIKNQMTDNQQSIETTQKQIKQLNEKIQNNQQELDHEELAFGKQAKVMYEEGDVTFLNVLMDSTSIGDFLTRLDAFRMIATSNEKKITKIKTLQETINNEKQDSEEKLHAVVVKQQELGTLKETKKVLQQQKEDQIAELEHTISSKQNEADRIQAKIDFEKKEALLAKQNPILDAPGSFVSGATFSGSAGSIISFASSFKGVPYAWGGTSSNGFDCSGFTQYVYSHAGIPLSRTAASQFGQGVSVSESNLKPGDLVFFSTYAPGPTHVGIYIGFNMMINAEDSGVSVSNITNSYWGRRYIGARRILAE